MFIHYFSTNHGWKINTFDWGAELFVHNPRCNESVLMLPDSPQD